MLIKAKIDKGRCKGCGASIRWVRLHQSGKPHPLDPPIPISITIIEDDEELYEVDVNKLSHFNTCPNRDSFRKNKPPATTPIKAINEPSPQRSLF